MTRFVVATSGHVDHGKSTLVRALTGIEPDRLAEERRRGLTIDLGFAWFDLPSGRSVAFVDVPGHERFLGNMLAGLGPAPVVLFVVAADQGWQAQSSDHLAAAVALGIEHAVVALTRTDLATPQQLAATRAEVERELAGTAIASAAIVPVCALTGEGLDALRQALDTTLAGVPAPDPEAPVRLWIDRGFTISGAGTVVTGTLADGQLRLEDRLELWRGGEESQPAQVRGLQRGGTDQTAVAGVSRVAVNLRGVPAGTTGRGDVLLSPDHWWRSDRIDVRRVSGPEFTELPRELSLHIGTATHPVVVRAFDAEHARLQLPAPLPLRIGDRLVLRDPGAHSVLGGARILDVDPPELRRRGDGRRRGQLLAELPVTGSLTHEVERRAAVPAETLERFGIAVPAQLPDALVRFDTWIASKRALTGWARRLRQVVADDLKSNPLTAGVPRDAALDALQLPDVSLLPAVIKLARLATAAGRIQAPKQPANLGPAEVAIAKLEQQLRANPFVAPDADTLAALRVGPRELAAAERVGRLVRIADGIVLLPDAPARAAAELARLRQPFTVSEARQQLGTTRRVAVPLLELLDRRQLTHRIDETRREVILVPN